MELTTIWWVRTEHVSELVNVGEKGVVHACRRSESTELLTVSTYTFTKVEDRSAF